MQIQGSRFLVTGGASGMGRHFTLALAKMGADVAFCDLNDEGIQAVVAEAESLPGKVVGFSTNVAEEEQVTRLIADAVEALGSLDGIINNAGIIRDGLLVKKDRNTGEIKKLSMKKWQQVIDVNLTGVFLGAREFAAYAIENNRPGVIISISSISRYGNRGQSNYSAAKAGIVAMTKLWGQELARYKIRTGAVAPGFTRTPILDGMPPEMLEKLIQPIPLRRIGEPEEMFQTVKFIIENEYFTGQVIDVNGGQVL
ncbi:MAG: SDR family oxidoreductase [Myxococcota bacterium]